MNIFDFSAPVHRALHSRELLAGIPHVAALVLLIVSVITVYTAKMYFFLPVILILYITCRILTKKDQFMLEIILSSLQQDDFYLP